MGRIKLKRGETKLNTNSLRITFPLLHYIHISIESQKDSPPVGVNKIVKISIHLKLMGEK